MLSRIFLKATKVKTIYIVGTSGFAKEVAQLIRTVDNNEQAWGRICYVSESKVDIGRKLCYGSVDRVDDDLVSIGESVDVVLALGDPKIRSRVYENLKINKKLNFPNIIHPDCKIDLNYVSLGIGNILTSGVKITCDINIGNFNILNLNSTVGHDVRIGSFNTLNPGCSVSGFVSIGDQCLIGTCSCVIDKVDIVSNVKVGAGAVVAKSIIEHGTYVGIPARKLAK